MRNILMQIKQSITFFFLIVLIAFTGVANAADVRHVVSGVIVTKTNGAGLTNPVISSASIATPVAFSSSALCNAHLAGLEEAIPVTDVGGDGSTFPTVRFYVLGKCSPVATVAP